MSISVMKKLTVITPIADAHRIMKKLVDVRCVEVRKLEGEEYDGFVKSQDYDKKSKSLKEKLDLTECVLPVLNKYTSRSQGLGDTRVKVDRDEFIKDGSLEGGMKLVLKTNKLMEREEELKALINELSDDITSMTPWENLEYFTSFTDTKNTKILLGTLPKGIDDSALFEEISEYDVHFEIINEDKNVKYVMFIALNENYDSFSKIISKYGFAEIKLKAFDMTPHMLIQEFKEKIAECKESIEKIHDEYREIANYISDVEVLYDILSTELLSVDAMQKTLNSEKCSFITGWMPQEQEEKVSKILDKYTCAYEMREAEDGEDVPVNLKNNSIASTFEWVIGMYSYPKYGSFDPTFIMSIFYFIIFGLMFADVGYGLILTVAGFMLPSVMGMRDGTKRMFYMFGICGISCMIMGVIFGGWFGDLPYAIMENMMGIENAKEAVPFFNGLWFNPIDDPMLFLVVSLAVGGVHLIAGMMIKFVLLCKEGKVFDAIFDIMSWWVIFAGIGVIFLVGTKEGLITIGVGALMIVLTSGRKEKNIIMKFLKGLLGLYDITSYASDLLSYSRILALGLAAGVIGQVVNLVGTMGGATIGGFIALIAACLIGHTLNLAINILGSFVHTSRLQYLEFFNKFYEDGGEKFEPLAPSEEYSKQSKK